MRSRIPLFALLFAVSFLALPLAAHAGIPFFGPIIPAAYNNCAASWGLLITVINNIISLLITLAIVFVAPLTIAYAGFLYVVNPVDPSGISKAKGILWNTVIGIVIALSGWMIVDAIMAVLYNPGADVPGGKIGAWSDLIGSGGISPCISLVGSLNQVAGQPTGTGVTGVSATGALNAPLSSKQTGTACDPATVQAAAPGLSTMQANILACLAQPESSCGTVNLNYNWNKGTSPTNKASTAAGPFQVLLASNHSCYENTACLTAAGVSGPLNCQNGFDNLGNPISTQATLVQTCVQAAGNLNCSASAAACLLTQNGGNFSPWQPAGNNTAQTACINNGGV